MINRSKKFSDDKLRKIFEEKKSVLDIGGGLRVSKEKGNRFDPSRAWMAPLLEKVKYTVLDPVPDYSPDVVGDIHNLPFPDNSQEAILCISVLEHVEDPKKACQEIHRVLEPGGYCFIHVPFLFYYHAEKGYYHDYWRFTEDGMRHLCCDFSKIEIAPVRGAAETWIHLSPLGRIPLVGRFARFIDEITGKWRSKQTSGYSVFLVK